jgi:hypothetical protein
MHENFLHVILASSVDQWKSVKFETKRDKKILNENLQWKKKF